MKSVKLLESRNLNNELFFWYLLCENNQIVGISGFLSISWIL